MKREDIKAGDVIVLDNGNDFRIVYMDGNLYTMFPNSYRISGSLAELCYPDLRPKEGISAIKSIYRDGKLIWTKPIELTIAEIENALKLTPGSLRIKD